MLFGEKVKNKKGLPDLTLLSPSLQGNMGDNFAPTNWSSICRGKMNESNILTYPSVKGVGGCSFCNENNWFCGDSSPKPDPHCFSAVPGHSHWTKPVWAFLEWTCPISKKIFVIDIILFRDTAGTLKAHPSRTWCHNSSAELQNLAKNQSF